MVVVATAVETVEEMVEAATVAAATVAVATVAVAMVAAAMAAAVRVAVVRAAGALDTRPRWDARYCTWICLLATHRSPCRASKRPRPACR